LPPRGGRVLSGRAGIRQHVAHIGLGRGTAGGVGFRSRRGQTNGDQGLVRIADTPDAFIPAAASALAEGRPRVAADRYLAKLSWDRTWSAMNALLEGGIHAARAPIAVHLSAPTLQQVPTMGSALAVRRKCLTT